MKKRWFEQAEDPAGPENIRAPEVPLDKRVIDVWNSVSNSDRKWIVALVEAAEDFCGPAGKWTEDGVEKLVAALVQRLRQKKEIWYRFQSEIRLSGKKQPARVSPVNHDLPEAAPAIPLDARVMDAWNCGSALDRKWLIALIKAARGFCRPPNEWTYEAVGPLVDALMRIRKQPEIWVLLLKKISAS